MFLCGIKSKMKKLLFAIIFLFSTVCHAKIDVVFAIDNNYPIYAMLMINSIMKNNVSNSDYTFWVLETGVTDENKTKMTDYVKSVGQEIKFITVPSKYIEEWQKLYKKHITPIAMSRILIPELLPQEIEKALYLDCDMLVAEDLKTLFDEDLGDKYVGMVQDQLWHREKYMNAGVMLFNMPLWRINEMSQKMMIYLKQHEKEFSCAGKYPFWITPGCYVYQDQDLIHLFLRNKTKELDPKWNNEDIKNEDVNMENQRGIYHYIGGGERKPWNSQVSAPQRLYMLYWRQSPLAPEIKNYSNFK